MMIVFLFILWFVSCIFAAIIVDERKITRNPLSLFVVLAPIVSTCYVLFRVKDLFHLLFPDIGEDWIKDTFKKL